MAFFSLCLKLQSKQLNRVYWVAQHHSVTQHNRCPVGWVRPLSQVAYDLIDKTKYTGKKEQ